MKRPGYTLVELLVAVAIVAVLVALLLTAVQKVRSRAATANSQHALRQIALACHNYDAAHGALPGTGHTLTADGDPVVFFDILPHIEQSAVYEEFTRGPGSRVTAPTAPGTGPGRVIATYISAADYTNPERTVGGLGCASYAANRSAFGDGAGLARSFPAGTSRTILFAERLMVCGEVPNHWYSVSPRSLVFAAAPPPGNYGPAAPGTACDPERVCSPIPQGIVVALADGSVRLVTPSAAAENWLLACDPDCGQALPDTW